MVIYTFKSLSNRMVLNLVPFYNNSGRLPNMTNIDYGLRVIFDNLCRVIESPNICLEGICCFGLLLSVNQHHAFSDLSSISL